MIIDVKSTGLAEYHKIPVGQECYRCIAGDKAPITGAMVSIPCGVCPRIRQCTPDGLISPTLWFMQRVDPYPYAKWFLHKLKETVLFRRKLYATKVTSQVVPITIIEGAVAKGAACLDGSPPAYQFDAGSGDGVNNWLLHIQGGGWCYSVNDCRTRTYNKYGSSKNMKSSDYNFTGILSNKQALNPNFYNWNRVAIRYCDGSSFTGDIEEVDPVSYTCLVVRKLMVLTCSNKQPHDFVFKATNLHFRGARVFDVIIQELLGKGMKSASKFTKNQSRCGQALLSGSSAGGLASLLHCDKFRAFFPTSTQVKCLSDAGYFAHVNKLCCHICMCSPENIYPRYYKPKANESLNLNRKDLSGEYKFEGYYDQVVNLHGSSKHLNQECISKMKHSLCFYPQYAIPYVKTPIFLLHSTYDTFQVQNILASPQADPNGLFTKCKQDINACTTDQIQRLQSKHYLFSFLLKVIYTWFSYTKHTLDTCDTCNNTFFLFSCKLDFRSEFLNALSVFGNGSSRGWFITNCFTHGQCEYGSKWLGNSSWKLNNKAIAEAVGDWFYDRSTVQMMDNQNVLPHYCKTFSTRFSSVHGEKPSAEYAKLRKESLESEFGNALTSRSKRLSMYFSYGPFLALYRAAFISYEVFKLSVGHFFIHDVKERAAKLGQALSTRPDILPSVYRTELAKLQDQIPPFPTKVAIRSIETQLGAPISQLFADISPEPMAAASLGQVYKAHLHTGELVAVKVQRPGMSLSLTLDALLFNMIGGQLKRFAKARKDIIVAVNETVRHMFEEIDYILEGQNCERFASLYGFRDSQEEDTYPNEKWVRVPKIYWNYTRKAVLTMEWLDGIKLNNDAALRDASLNRKELIDKGLYCSLMQLLEVGFFHADPHPGNLVATKEGALAYFDFGMMGDIPRHYRVGLIQVLVHFVNRDSLGLAHDFLSLGFLPEGVDMQLVSDALKKSFGDGTRQSQDFQAIMNQLYDVMYEFNFSLPPDYALVIRALGSLEGTAKTLDPEFKVVESAYPFVIGRLLADPSPDMRKILRELLIRNDGSIRWNRLERLVAAISVQSSPKAGKVDEANRRVDDAKTNKSSSSPLEANSFDMHAVVASTEDLFKFILSEKGYRVRLFIVRDIIGVADIFLDDQVTSCMFGDDLRPKPTLESKEGDTLKRVINGFVYFWQAVKLAPDVWTGPDLQMESHPLMVNLVRCTYLEVVHFYDSGTFYRSHLTIVTR
ncbi:protein kinase superfamily protein [Artemisia annua]|uniref:Protein kinase superfamily protein n=1 Tax=Artemisia annua TaxID=35608 RepID=A0A2U1Q1Y8_ARTAN|nr:protein kinase superfamily protein [Artemisia annua]